MKVEGTLIIMSFLGTMSHSSRLLKVPRIYNALITSDENLQPSQTYPAIAPVIRSIQYPLPGYVGASSGVHKSSAVFPSQVQLPDGRTFDYSIKEASYHHNFVEMGGQNIKIDLPKIPEIDIHPQPALFRPAVSAYSHSVPPSAVVMPQQMADQNVYFKFVPAQPTDSSASVSPVEKSGACDLPQKRNPPSNHGEDSYQPSKPVSNSVKLGLSVGSFPPPLDDLLKNYRPKDPSIVDVPPPPLPVGRKANVTKKEEYSPISIRSM